MQIDSTSEVKRVTQASVGRMLNRLSRRLNSEMIARLGEIDLTMNGFFILMQLFDVEGQTQSALGKKIGLPPYSMTRLIDSLQELALVERREDPNSRRNHHIYLTDAGHALRPQIFEIVRSVNDWLLQDLEPDEKQRFADTLAKLL